jgi:hypothetical protein
MTILLKINQIIKWLFHAHEKRIMILEKKTLDMKAMKDLFKAQCLMMKL